MPENVGWIIPIDRIWFIVDVRILEYALFMNVTNNLSIIFFFLSMYDIFSIYY